MLCVLIRIASSMQKIEKISLHYHHLLPDLVPCLTHSGLNYPYLEQIPMVPKMIELLKFDCLLIKELKMEHTLSCEC